MRIERVSREASDKLTIADLKGYINVTSEDRDEELQSILNAAICKVEDITGYSLTAQTIRIYAEDVQVQKLYFPTINEVVSVVNEETGSDASYTLNHSKTKVILNELSDIEIEYNTVPIEDKVNDLKHYVYSLAGIYYDGQQEKEHDILKTIPRDIC